MSDYFDLLEIELRAAVPRAVAAGAPTPAGVATLAGTPVPAARRRDWLRPGVVPAAIGITATLLVVGLALVMPGHGHATPSSAGRTPRTPATARPSTVPPRNPGAPRPARDMLSARGIAGIRFGQSRAAVVAALDRLLGTPGTHPRSYRGDCGLGGSITWWDQPAAPGQPSLTVYFAHDRLVGYQYGTPGGQLLHRLPTHSPTLATTRGLTVGDTLARGRRLYGNAFKISTAQGGSWKVTTASGPIDGYASGVPRPGNLNAIKVLTIDAGQVGCPAVSP